MLASGPVEIRQLNPSPAFDCNQPPPERSSMLTSALLCVQPSALLIHSRPAAGFIHAARPMANVKLVATADLGATMLTLMDKWVLDDEISKPYETDETADACMVPIELECARVRVRVRVRSSPLTMPHLLAQVAECEGVRDGGVPCRPARGVHRGLGSRQVQGRGMRHGELAARGDPKPDGVNRQRRVARGAARHHV